MKNDEYRKLETLGFSKGEIACYQSLATDGSALAQELADRLGRRPSNLYRELKRLEERGFVTSINTELGPTYFSSVRLDEALYRLDNYYRHLFRDIILDQRRG